MREKKKKKNNSLSYVKRPKQTNKQDESENRRKTLKGQQTNITKILLSN